MEIEIKLKNYGGISLGHMFQGCFPLWGHLHFWGLFHVLGHFHSLTHLHFLGRLHLWCHLMPEQICWVKGLKTSTLQEYPFLTINLENLAMSRSCHVDKLVKCLKDIDSAEMSPLSDRILEKIYTHTDRQKSDL